MGSCDSRSSYSSSLGASRGLVSDNASLRARTHVERSERLETFRSLATEESAPPPPERDVKEVYKARSVRNEITSPAAGVKTVYLLVIDNSGSNVAVARRLRKSSGYLTAFLQTLDPESQIAFIYFSDHCDGKRLRQDIDFVHPDSDGDEVICSTLHHIQDADGGDPAEAIECILWDACDIDFADAENIHLILVTDVVAHGMGMAELDPDNDFGCRNQRLWRDSVKRVRETFTTFTVVGSGTNPEVGKLQEQFIPEDRVGYDLIRLDSIKEQRLRLGIIPNAILFLIARHRGEQSVELFFSSLYEKWLSEPIFGSETDVKAQRMICRLAVFLDWPKKKIKEIIHKVFGGHVSKSKVNEMIEAALNRELPE